MGKHFAFTGGIPLPKEIANTGLYLNTWKTIF